MRSPATPPALPFVEAEVRRHLVELEAWFRPGTLLTFLARTPGHDEADLVVTADDLHEVARAATRRAPRPPAS